MIATSGTSWSSSNYGDSGTTSCTTNTHGETKCYDSNGRLIIYTHTDDMSYDFICYAPIDDYFDHFKAFLNIWRTQHIKMVSYVENKSLKMARIFKNNRARIVQQSRKYVRARC